VGAPKDAGAQGADKKIEGLWLQPDRATPLPELRPLPLEPLFLEAAKEYFKSKQKSLFKIMMERLLTDCTAQNAMPHYLMLLS
jgi:hypothetical protein